MKKKRAGDAVRRAEIRCRHKANAVAKGAVKLLTVAEVAAVWEINPATVRKMVAVGMLRCVDLTGSGRRLRFMAEDVNEFVKERRRIGAGNGNTTD